VCVCSLSFSANIYLADAEINDTLQLLQENAKESKGAKLDRSHGRFDWFHLHFTSSGVRCWFPA